MKNLKIDIVSDVSCPWCIIGYKGLERALADEKDTLSATISWFPFELNPNMPQEGQEIVEHLTEKYGINETQIEQNRQMIHQRGLDVGYEFGKREGGRIYNTFDAHRLLHWSKGFGKQTQLKLALFDLYFKQGGNPSDHAQLLNTVESVGLSQEEAKQVLASEQFVDDVRSEQQMSQQNGITSVPAMIVNNKYLVSGGQSPESYKEILNQIANETA